MTKKIYRKRKNKIYRGEPPNYLGQHFMHNKKLIKDIVDQAAIMKSDNVLELGAGKGQLTGMLSQRASKVIAVEYDAKLVNHLRGKQLSNLQLIQQDILKFRLPKHPFVLVSNIPYSITTPIMKKILVPFSGFQRGVIVMEKGAAKRFTAKMVKDRYIITWRMYFNMRLVRGISRDNFSPPPKVDSAMVYISRKKDPLLSVKDYRLFKAFVDAIWQHPLLSIDEALSVVFTRPQIKHVKKNLGIKQEFPVGALTEFQWQKIFIAMVQYVPKTRWPRIKG